MKSISKLKDQARTFEQKEDWEKAIGVYLQVLQASDQGDESDLPLYNRIGDLYVRLGRPEEAVKYYEQAADRYAEAGLFNNAIALCNKALRYVPKRWPIYRKLGQFSASQGFLTDARRWFFEYAEQMFKTGNVDDAFSALTDFVNISDDAEIRELLGKQLHAHGRSDKALAELRRAYNMRLRAGQTAEAEAVAAQMREIDPNADLSVDTAAPPPEDHRHAEALPGLEDIGIESPAGSAFGADAGVGLDAGNITLDSGPIEIESHMSTFEHGNIELGEISAETQDEVVEPLPTIDLSTDTDEDEAAYELPELPGFDDEEDEHEAEPLPLMDLGGTDVEEEAADDGFLEIAPFGEREEAEPADEEAAFDLPMLSMEPVAGEEEEAAAETAFELPGFDEPEPEVEPEPEPEIETPPVAARIDADAEVVGARSLAASGNRSAAISRLEELHPALAESGDFHGAITIIRELVRLEPGNLRMLQQHVEYAGRLGENAPLVAAMLEMADQLAKSGSQTKARAVYARVLDIDPGNKAAQAALQPKKASPAKAGGDYVDLNSFLTDDDDEGSTRFVVAEKAPTGDEERDFADLLSQFKAKVAENVGADDPASHYDLGLAFKEMGLVDEAISEFQVALKGGQEKLQVYEELGQCFMLKEQYNVAVKVLSRALQMPRSDEAELLGVYYHLGRCFEELGNRGEAKDAYERVIGLDIQFRDVSERLARL